MKKVKLIMLVVFFLYSVSLATADPLYRQIDVDEEDTISATITCTIISSSCEEGVIFNVTFCETATDGICDGEGPGIVGLSLTSGGSYTDEVQTDLEITSLGWGRTDNVYVKGLVPGETIVGAYAPGVGWFDDPGPFIFTVLGEFDVEILPLYSELDGNPNSGGGWRIYPGKSDPTDSMNRKLVRVKVTNATPGTTIYLKSFDIDDPSTDEAPIDTLGSAGDDNRGDPKEGYLHDIVLTVDSSGNAETLFEVTMHPGDNFKIAASSDLESLEGVTVDLNGVDLVDADGVKLPTEKTKVTSMLTVWRKIHIEVDTMGPVIDNFGEGLVRNTRTKYSQDGTYLQTKVSLRYANLEKDRFQNGLLTLNGFSPFDIEDYRKNWVLVYDPNLDLTSVSAGTPCKIFDDDDFNNNDYLPKGDVGEDIVAPEGIHSLIKFSDSESENIFKPAYIMPIIDGGGDPIGNNGDVIFSSNVSDTSAAITKQIELGRSSAGNEADDFWVAYVQYAYQPGVKNDNDPDSEEEHLGGTPGGGKVNDVSSAADVPPGAIGTLIYLETLRDTIKESGQQQLLEQVVPHEIGHQFGLDGDTPGFGVMSYGEPLVFVDRHLNILRWRVKSPGSAN